jgi:hypothetical protein
MKHLALLVIATALLAGCIILVPGHLYPVEGPLASQSPPPIYTVTISGIVRSGTMKATLAGGEACKGSWSAVAQNDPTANRMAAEWDRVYGAGFFTANVLGNPVFARGTLTSPQGTTLDVEFYLPVPGHLESAKGVARDNRGNIYKLTF